MPHDLPPEQARDLANLRLEVSALASKINVASLPEQLRSVRRTIGWSAMGIAFALALSGILHSCGTSKVERLERRIEVLEGKSLP